MHDLQTPGTSILHRAEFDILDVELGLQQLVVGLDCVHILGHHSELGERLAHADLGGLAQGQSAGNDLAHLLHRGDQSRIVNQNATKFGIRTGLLVHYIRPVGQMHGLATGQATPHGLGFHRSKRRKHAHERLKHGVQRVERVRILVPEAVTGVADVPIGEHVDEVGDRIAGVGNRELVQRLLHTLHQTAGAGQQIAIHLRQASDLVGTQLTSVESGPAVGRVGVQREEVVGAPHRQHNLTHGVANAFGGDDQVAAAQNRRRHKEPAHSVGTVLVEHAVHVRVVAQMLGHLLAVGAKHDAVADHVLERRTVEQSSSHDVQQVEPATGLTNVFDDVVGREVLFELLLVLERVVELRERHGTGLEPAIEHIRNTMHMRLAGRIIRVHARQVVDPRTVHIDVAVLVARVVAKVGLELLKRTVHVHTRVLRVIGHPHRNRGTPETVAGD